MKIPNESINRFDLWTQIINQKSPKNIAEIGVWKGDFAASILDQCPSIEKYLMIDPWANLPDWNKPFNVTPEAFTEIYEEAMHKTEFASGKRVVLKGRTKDVIEDIDEESLDFVYIDGDHTLRGITIDLISILPKIKAGGLIAGDDFTLSPWQHSSEYEPTLVCPFAVYFAEAMNLPIHALHHGQFLIEKTKDGFSFNDTTGRYGDLGLNKLPETNSSFLRRLKQKVKTLIK
jgi:predicted O-methyltransferase YrrM